MMRRDRVVIRGVRPQVECGRFHAKAIDGDEVVVEAVVFADGHEIISCLLQYRHESESVWSEAEMQPLWNDQWRGSFRVETLGAYFYTVTAWVDGYRTWHSDLRKRIEAGHDISVYLPIGVDYVKAAARRATGRDRDRLNDAVSALSSAQPGGISTILNDEVDALMLRYADRSDATTHRELPITVDRARARYSTWYEMFPRSAAREPGRHGTLRDCARLVPEIAEMGFDVLYLPPIHPIGMTHRKGKNNATLCVSGDPGSPWAIGSVEGGHKAVHPQLGTLAEFDELIEAAGRYGMEIALDIAFQCSPDHPYVREHPEWFRRRADGTVQYAENPPKEYEDIYPLHMVSEHSQALWHELKSILEFWIEHGVRIFRVDNPHTKPFAFWEWMIQDLKRRHPGLILLSEAFTRPNVMYWLAKLGFTQSYTYFTWRNTKRELIDYFTELTETEVRDYFRPNLWPNTPDILHETLQRGGRPAFISRLILAATLGASYGIYGPAYELCENTPREPGSEEYLNSEKYEIKYRDLSSRTSLRGLIAAVNRIRRENAALHTDAGLQFHNTDNDQIICYSKRTANRDNLILVAVNLDPLRTQAGFVELPAEDLGIDLRKPYRVRDLLTRNSYQWQGPRNYVELRPHEMPAHILKIE